MKAFSALKMPEFVLDRQQIDACLLKLADSDKDNTMADRQARGYYRHPQHRLIWIDSQGVDHRADTLLAWLGQVKDIGFSEDAFFVSRIAADLSHLRSLDLNGKSASRLAAQLEYNLTKACLRYCYGHRFGFVNPQQVFNNLDVEKSDTLKKLVRYRGLFDVEIDRPDKNYAEQVLQKVANDSLGDYLSQIQPQDSYYLTLKSSLAKATMAGERKRIIINMERSRWRRHQPIPSEGKRIVVNIPAYHLYAYSDTAMLDMKVVCGNLKTKTPQLSSNIEWMEVNPQWVIPMSIIETDVARRAGDSAYFARNRYVIHERTTNKPMSVGSVSRQMLLSGKYRVAQMGGAGNSLGRIVFRFKNNFSVYLHDTSNPGAFERSGRAISHGCVRVSRPFDLARFVLDSPDDWLLDKIRIAMGIPAETERGSNYEQTHPDVEERNKVIGYVPVKPRVPIYIIYYTLWPDQDGMMQVWDDVYGYDNVMWTHLQPFLTTL